MIKVEHLTKTYAAVKAVNDISFNVDQNEIIGFLGPNGAGKSTTIKVLTAYHAATSGKVTVDGHDVFEEPEKVKGVIGYLPENVPLYPELRVDEYLSYRAGIKKIPRSKRKAAVDTALKRCRLLDVRRRIIGQLSKGYRQRVGLADALIADPKILILDEPTIGLDPNQIRDVRSLIKELGKERTVILSSHILPEVEAVCSRVIIINKGKIVGQGKPEELRQQINKQGKIVTVELLDLNGKAEQAINSLKNVVGVDVDAQNNAQSNRMICRVAAADGKDIREDIFDAAVAEGFKILEMSSADQSLEDIFVEITTQEEQAPKDTEKTDS